MKTLILSILILALAGCATYATAMKNPSTGQVQMCQSGGVGLVPMMAAQDLHDKCVDQLRKAGYVPQ